jgi:hypothetical protein
LKEGDIDGTEDDPPHPLIAGVIAGDPLRVLGLQLGEVLPPQARAHVQHTVGLRSEARTGNREVASIQ